MAVCLECGRKLKSQQSKEYGYGPVCYKKVFGNSIKKNYLGSKKETVLSDTFCYDIPGQMSIWDFIESEK